MVELVPTVQQTMDFFASTLLCISTMKTQALSCPPRGRLSQYTDQIIKSFVVKGSEADDSFMWMRLPRRTQLRSSMSGIDATGNTCPLRCGSGMASSVADDTDIIVCAGLEGASFNSGILNMGPE